MVSAISRFAPCLRRGTSIYFARGFIYTSTQIVIRPPKVLFPFLVEALWASCPLLPASCFPDCLDVARYAFINPENNTQDISEQSTQSLMTIWVQWSMKIYFIGKVSISSFLVSVSPCCHCVYSIPLPWVRRGAVCRLAYTRDLPHCGQSPLRERRWPCLLSGGNP